MKRVPKKTLKTKPTRPSATQAIIAARAKVAQHAENTGHIDPTHAASLLRMSRETDQHDANVGFVARPRSKDSMAEQLGEEAVSAMTSGESNAAADWDEHVEEEDGGPFVETSGDQEFADGTDASNISEATREPFPKTSASR